MISPIALLSDVHGNAWALEAVLADIQRRAITTILNLGDSVYGSLDPAGSAELLMRHCTLNISGNQDRIVHTPDEATRQSADFRFVTQRLSAEQVDWLRTLPATHQYGPIFCCHGTPTSDDTYLLEEVTEHGVFLGASASILTKIGQVEAEVIVCGHSHVPRIVWLPNGQLVVNPGSVGIPAYDHDQPFLHVMESGSPHARYAILSKREDSSMGNENLTGTFLSRKEISSQSNLLHLEVPVKWLWQVELIAVPYDWHHAASVARSNGRPDRASWIETGRATL